MLSVRQEVTGHWESWCWTCSPSCTIMFLSTVHLPTWWSMNWWPHRDPWWQWRRTEISLIVQVICESIVFVVPCWCLMSLSLRLVQPEFIMFACKLDCTHLSSCSCGCSCRSSCNCSCGVICHVVWLVLSMMSCLNQFCHLFNFSFFQMDVGYSLKL